MFIRDRILARVIAVFLEALEYLYFKRLVRDELWWN
jgi:hypothetical protein